MPAGDAVIVWLYAEPYVPFGKLAGAIVMVGHEMTIVYVGLTPVQPLPSVTFTVMGKVPACVGVPDSVPFSASTKPGGKEPLLSVKFAALPSAPTCVNVWLNGAPTVPVATAGALTVMLWQTMTSV